MGTRYEIKKSSKGQFFFSLKAGNGEIVLTSQMYSARSGADSGIESVRTNASIDDRYERKTSTGVEPQSFVLKAANGQPIGKSETYWSSSAMNKGIESVKKNAPDAKVDDLT